MPSQHLFCFVRRLILPRPFLLLGLLLGLAQVTVYAADDSAQQTRPRDKGAEIHYLLDHIAGSDCTFYRNGKAYAPERAADHLSMKYNRVKRHIPSAETFIEKIASESSLTGRDYQVECRPEQRRAAGPWLRDALAQYRAGSAQSGDRDGQS